MRYYSNTAVETSLSGSISSSATSVSVAAVTGFPTSYPYTLSIDADNASKEIIEVTAAAGTTLTVTRGVDGTSGVSHSLGAAVRHDHSARDFREPQEHIAATTNVHGISGALVDTGSSQTLTGKNLSSGNTFPASLLTTTGTQTVTNKDLSSGTNTFPSSLTTDTELTAERSASTTLTNKTLALGSNTITGTIAQFNTACTDADFATQSDVTTINSSLAGKRAAAFKGCRVTRTASQSVALNTAVAIEWDAETYDTSAYHDISTNNTRLTIPASLGGYYRVVGQVSMDADFTASGDVYLWLRKNGATVVKQLQWDTYSTDYWSGQIEDVFNLSVGDYLELFVQYTAGAARSALEDGTGAFTSMTLEFVGT